MIFAGNGCLAMLGIRFKNRVLRSIRTKKVLMRYEQQ